MAVLFIILIILSLAGCYFAKVNAEEKSQENLTGGKQQTEEKQEPLTGKKQGLPKNSIAGVKLGTTKDEVLKIWGSEYEEELIDDLGYYIEQYYVWKYAQGITVLVGAESEKVLEIEVTSPDFTTDLGVKVGDRAQDIAKIYGSLYTVPESIHGDGQLEGWYNLDDDQLMIFDFDIEDESLVNTNVQPDTQVEKIRLTCWKFFD